uniref:Lysine-rich nucleolar protein 1 n=1 Tax=Steinernema glaseri TaxID=37863 RepID=A0A1I8AU84_9BILA
MGGGKDNKRKKDRKKADEGVVLVEDKIPVPKDPNLDRKKKDEKRKSSSGFSALFGLGKKGDKDKDKKKKEKTKEKEKKAIDPTTPAPATPPPKDKPKKEKRHKKAEHPTVPTSSGVTLSADGTPMPKKKAEKKKAKKHDSKRKRQSAEAPEVKSSSGAKKKRSGSHEPVGAKQVGPEKEKKRKASNPVPKDTNHAKPEKKAHSKEHRKPSSPKEAVERKKEHTSSGSGKVFADVPSHSEPKHAVSESKKASPRSGLKPVKSGEGEGNKDAIDHSKGKTSAVRLPSPSVDQMKKAERLTKKRQLKSAPMQSRSHDIIEGNEWSGPKKPKRDRKVRSAEHINDASKQLLTKSAKYELPKAQIDSLISDTDVTKTSPDRKKKKVKRAKRASSAGNFDDGSKRRNGSETAEARKKILAVVENTPPSSPKKKDSPSTGADTHKSSPATKRKWKIERQETPWLSPKRISLLNEAGALHPREESDQHLPTDPTPPSSVRKRGCQWVDEVQEKRHGKKGSKKLDETPPSSPREKRSSDSDEDTQRSTPKKRDPMESTQVATQKKRNALSVNMEEVARIGTVFDRLGVEEDRKKAFEWLAKNREQIDEDPSQAARQLLKAVGDVPMSKDLVEQTLKFMMTREIITRDEYKRHFKKMAIDNNNPVTIVQLAHLLTVYVGAYKASSPEKFSV